MKGYLSVTFQDSFGQSTVRQYELQDGVGASVSSRFANLRSKALQLLDAIQPITGLKIINTAVVVTDAEFVISVATEAESGSNVSDDGVLSVALDNGGKGYLRIPSPKLTLVDTNGRPDATDELWRTFSDQFSQGMNGTLSDGETVDTNQGSLGILKTWRASRGRRNN